jgi:DNA-binding YbaB/EbfC family protein
MSEPIDFGKLMKMFGNLQENAQRVQERLATEKVTGESGGGMVVVEMNGLQRVTRVTIDPQLVREGDTAMLEDLVASAVNRAQEATQRLIRENALGRLDLGDLLGQMKGE